MSASAINELIAKRESSRLTFKSAEAEPHEIAATVCALLNTHGGTVIVGVRERSVVEPVKDADKFAKDIERYLNENLSPPALWSVHVDETSQGSVITIDVPEGDNRPHVCSGSIYVREGKQTVAANAATIRQLVHEQYMEPTSWERLVASDLELDDLDVDEIRRTIEDAQRKRNYVFHNADDLSAVLADLGLTEAGQLTNGADVLFAKTPSRRLPQTRIRATVFTTDKGGDFADDRVFEGNAFTLLEQVSGFVAQHVRIAGEFKSGQISREDRPQYPFWSLREGLINAIVHRDYSVFVGGMSVGIYPTRIEVWNTGRLPKELKISDLKKSHPSLPANPSMAHVFYLRGIIECVGRGTLKIVEECKTAGLRLPQWKEAASGITLTFFSQERRRRLNKRQKDLLNRLEPGQELKPSDYYAEVESVISQRQAQRDLASLEADGWLRQEGEGPSTVYVRIEQKPA